MERIGDLGKTKAAFGPPKAKYSALLYVPKDSLHWSSSRLIIFKKKRLGDKDIQTGTIFYTPH